MSCEFTYSPAGRAGIGVIQPQSGLDYPLAQPSDDIRYLLADFYLAFDDPGAAITPPLRIQYLYNVGCEDGPRNPSWPTPRAGEVADIVVVDSAGLVVLDSTVTNQSLTYSARDWGADYKIYEWVTADVVCRLVAYTTWTETDGDARHYAKYLAPQNATLDPRAIYRMPRRVRSLSVRQNSGPLVLGPYTGKVIFSNGYNTLLVAGPTTTTNFVVNTDVTFSAEPGTGEGYYPICGDVVDEETQENIPQPIITINGINGTPDGNFFLVGQDCIYVRRPTGETENCVTIFNPDTQESVTTCATKAVPLVNIDLELGTDCPPCCECGDYVKTALYMNTVYDNYKKIADTTEAVKQKHEENIARWASRLSCVTANPLKLLLFAQNCPYVDVIAMICNTCDECFSESRLSLDLDGGPAFELVCGYTELVGAGKNKTAVINIAGKKLSWDMPVVNSCGSAYLKFRLKFETKQPRTITGTLTGEFKQGTRGRGDIRTGCSGGQLAEVIKTETLNCDGDGGTVRPC